MIPVFRALDWLSSISGAKIMAQNATPLEKFAGIATRQQYGL